MRKRDKDNNYIKNIVKELSQKKSCTISSAANLYERRSNTYFLIIILNPVP
jgi:hypothetical protein